MEELHVQESPLMQLLSALADLMILSLLWLVGCIPVVTIGASTTALYTCVMKRRTDGDIRCVREFWDAFKRNFGQASLLWGVAVVLLGTVAADVYLVFFTELAPDTVIKLLILMVVLVLLLVVSYIFPLQSYFVNAVGQTLKNAVLLAIMYLPVSLVILFLNLVPLLVWLLIPEFFTRTLLLWAALSPGIIAYINGGMFQRIFVRHITKESDTE